MTRCRERATHRVSWAVLVAIAVLAMVCPQGHAREPTVEQLPVVADNAPPADLPNPLAAAQLPEPPPPEQPRGRTDLRTRWDHGLVLESRGG